MWSFSYRKIRLQFQHLRDTSHIKANHKAFLYWHATASTSGVNLYTNKKEEVNKQKSLL